MRSTAELESRRFGLKIQRFQFDTIDRSAARAVRAEQPDVAIIRVPSSAIYDVHQLSFGGASPIVGDTLVYYECDLETIEIQPLRNDQLDFQQGTEVNRRDLEILIESSFGQYRNHYAANPYLDRAAALAGYIEWGLSFLGGDNGKMCWLAINDGRPIAFAGCAAGEREFEGVLYGVHPDAAGSGIYGDLVSFTQKAARDAGYQRMKVSTQIDNLAVQRAWVKRGFRLERSLNTIHLNLFLSEQGPVKPLKKSFTISSDLVEAFGSVVGDLNPVHFDQQAAAAAGFENRLAHGALVNGIISGLLGNELPGPGTIYIEQNGSYLRPIYVTDEVTFEVVVKHMDESSGRLVAATRAYVRDSELAYTGQARLANPEFVRLHSLKNSSSRTTTNSTIE